jgi:hypothetical protein
MPASVKQITQTLSSLDDNSHSQLLNLTGDMTYYLTTSYKPATSLLFYQPWFDRDPRLRNQVETALINQTADVVLIDDRLPTFAPEIFHLIVTTYHPIQPNLYLRRKTDYPSALPGQDNNTQPN